MRSSVILSTYNQPDWLERVLHGYACQSVDDFEIIIADDGSNDDTRARIDALRKHVPMPIQHIWQADDGFAKCRILNKAILASQTDYLIFSDGDCIPRQDFIQTHYHYREPGYFLSGGYVKLPRNVSHAITVDDIHAQHPFQLDWLFAHGLNTRKRMLKLMAGPKAARFLNAITTTKPTWNGHNASGWRNDIIAANGFDERMEYGGEDRELGERLFNKGLKSKQIRYSAICVHLDHDRGYVNQPALKKNRQIRDETAKLRRTQTEYGINQHA